MSFLKRDLIKSITSVFLLAVIIVSFFAIYIVGLVQGYNEAKLEDQNEMISFLSKLSIKKDISPTPVPVPTTQLYSPTPTKKNAVSTTVSWGGPDLWEAVNKRRIELGVNGINSSDDLCTIASIRLNELLELGHLDAHEGFTSMRERRPDLDWIFEKYSSVAEFLAMGGKTPEETVGLWENTLGHKKLLTGGEFVWGCIYAQDTFAVAITAY